MLDFYQWDYVRGIYIRLVLSGYIRFTAVQGPILKPQIRHNDYNYFVLEVIKQRVINRLQSAAISYNQLKPIDR